MTLSHVGTDGGARMVDVGDKPDSDRIASAEGAVRMTPEAFALVRDNALSKGEVLGVARIAGIQAAKQAGVLIPLCHPLSLVSVEVDPVLDAELPGVRITATARAVGKTGVEMEALTAVAVGCLTVYDMVKSADRGMVIEQVRLIHKSGGRSGGYTASPRSDR